MHLSLESASKTGQKRLGQRISLCLVYRSEAEGWGVQERPVGWGLRSLSA